MILGDGNVSFEEFVEIASNMGGSASSSSATDQNQEEQELRDAFRVRKQYKNILHGIKKKKKKKKTFSKILPRKVFYLINKKRLN